MDVERLSRLVLVLLVCLLALASSASAQQATGSIAGVVRDTSGAVMPGVTVEAASPALIEKVRAAVTDAGGQYKMVNLRPGTYVVSFTLPGFSTIRREGIELTTAFTATVNADMKVGTLEETVTVSGAAPIVDTQNILQQQTLARNTLDAIPNTKRMGSYATLVPAAVTGATTLDVGGTTGEQGATFSVHGGRANDQNINQDGMNLTLYGSTTYSFNPHNTQEIVIETSGISAESFTAGVLMNIVPKDGGNRVTGSFSTFYSNPDLQAENLTDALRARGLDAAPSLRKSYDVGGAIGGPIRRDRLWFFTGHRKWAASRFIPGNFYNKTQHTLFYTPDPDRPAYTNDYYQDHSLRLTWQASVKDKIAISYGNQTNCNCPIGSLSGTGGVVPAPEATGNHFYQPNWTGIVSWNRPVTNRLLLEAGASAKIVGLNAKRQPEVGQDDIAVTELSTNRVYGSRAQGINDQGSYGTNNINNLYDQRVGVSYVTGSHAFKSGFDLQEFDQRHRDYEAYNGINGARAYTFRNQLPTQVTIFATPFGIASHATRIGLFAQDQWTVRRLTLNLGARYDSFDARVPAQQFPAGKFVPARDLPAVKHSPYWKNVNPRVGAAYDLFGNGRTAVKGFVGRYAIGTSGNANTALNNPIVNQAASATRTWGDLNGNFIPDCVLDASVPGLNGECGAISDTGFGQVRAGTTRYADIALSGFNSQPYNWQASLAFQHQLLTGLAVNVAYFRTWYGAFRVTDNQFVTPADYSPYCITAPVDTRLPDGGGYQVCGLYDLSPALFGKTDNLVTLASGYGHQTEIYNGLDLTMNARFGQGGVVSGGASIGRSATDNCFVVDSPQQERPDYCNVSPPWSAGTLVKFLVVYPLPWLLQASATYQNLPGIPIAASVVATNGQILPSLGRNLAAGANATATIDIIPPSTMFEDRIQQMDLRFSRSFQASGLRIRANVDIYNLFNASPILAEITRYGAQWQNVLQILGGRVFKFGGQLDF